MSGILLARTGNLKIEGYNIFYIVPEGKNLTAYTITAYNYDTKNEHSFSVYTTNKITDEVIDKDLKFVSDPLGLANKGVTDGIIHPYWIDITFSEPTRDLLLEGQCLYIKCNSDKLCFKLCGIEEDKPKETLKMEDLFSGIASLGPNGTPITDMSNYIQKEDLNAIVEQLKHLNDIQDQLLYEARIAMLQKDGLALSRIPEEDLTEEFYSTAVQQNAMALELIKEPSDNIIMKAIQKDINALKFVNNPSDSVIELAVNISPSTTHYILKYIPEKFCFNRRF